MTSFAPITRLAAVAPASTPAMSIAICDPEQLFREGLQLLLGSAGADVRYVSSCLAEWDGEADVVIWGASGLADAAGMLGRLRAARDCHPHTRIVVVVGGVSSHLVRQLATAGADAVLSRDISSKVLHRALDLVILGQQLFPAAALGLVEEPAATQPGLTVKSMPGTPGTPALPAESGGRGDTPFSEREGQILRCLINGLSNKLIARELDITEATVKVHIKGLLRKIGASNRTQAAIWSLANGFAPDSGSARAAA